MKKIYTFFISLSLCISAAAYVVQRQNTDLIPQDFKPENIRVQYDMSKLKDYVPSDIAENGTTNSVKKVLMRSDAESVEPISYFVVGQTFYEGPTFKYEGGLVDTYNIDVTIDGTSVTFNNLFNFATTVVAEPTPLVGTYDPDAKTITIPTPTTFSEGTKVGKIYNFYEGILASGSVDEEGKMTPMENLVFHVEGDFESISTTQNFGVAQYLSDGSKSMGYFKVYRNFSITLPKAGASLLRFDENLNFPEVFPSTQYQRNYKIINTGLDATDYIVTVESDDDTFSTQTISGTLEGQKSVDLIFNFEPKVVGEYEGLATIEYEGGEPLLLLMSGSAKPVPDYSAIVENGDFEFLTGLDFPFEIVELDGTKVAHSTQKGRTGKAFIQAKTVVPEGQIGILSWKGKFNNTGGAANWYKVQGGIFVDDMNTAKKTFSDTDMDIADTIELAEGEHIIKFQFNQDYYTGLDTDLMYIYDLDIQFKPAVDDAGEILTPEVNFGNYLFDQGGIVSDQSTITLVNKGANPLKVTGVASDNGEFSAEMTTDQAATMEELVVPVKFEANTAGEKTAEITISTNAGDFKATLNARVIDRPDYSELVNEGKEYITEYLWNEKHPFIIEDGVAYNISSYEKDTSVVTSSFGFKYTIPEGKLGILTWDGHSYGQPLEDGLFKGGDTSWLLIDWLTGKDGLTAQIAGDVDAGLEALAEMEDNFTRYTTCVPGDYAVTYQYMQVGDGVYYGKDRLEISNIKLHVVDYVENKAELPTPEAEFDAVYVGPQRYSVAKVQLKNTGSNDLEVTKIAKSGPFYGVIPTKKATLNQTLDIDLWFMPETEGEFNNDIVIQTTAGDFTVSCHGKTNSRDGIIYVGDFEDNAYGWTTFDYNKDGITWDLGSNMWGNRPEYCHSGSECLVSQSRGMYGEMVQPDNWTISPNIYIPVQGAVLKYYVSAFHYDRYAENYSLYVVDTEKADNLDDVAESEPILTETLETPAILDEQSGIVTGWELREIDLTPYADKIVNLVFRHYDCEGQELLRLDDVFVYNKAEDGVDGIISECGNVVKSEIYSVSGIKLESLTKGVNIVRSYYEDGTVKSHKVIKK